MSKTHWPLPWTIDESRHSYNAVLVASDGYVILGTDSDESIASLKDMVRAVNAHNALIDACEELLESNVDLSLVEQRARCREVVTNAKAGAE